MTLVSVVTGTWNRIQPLQEMIASARLAIPSGIPYEFVIVDGGSTDGTVEWLQAQPDVHYNPGDLDGAIKAFNTGAEAATGKYVILANDDILFFPDSIMRAAIHLETNARCGAVAFADNRHAEYKRKPYAAAIMGVRGLPGNVGIYAQVGMFRRWLGNALNWWGYGELDARTYGGDNFLSARIYEAGYTVDAVDGAKIHDTIIEDELRQRGRAFEDTGYHKFYPDGPLASPEPKLPNPDKEALRILYLPVFENHKVQKAQKRGLREALGHVGIVWEIDYYNVDNPVGTFKEALSVFKPLLIVTQCQGADQLTTQLLQAARDYNRALVINWNGDYWLHGLTSREMLALLKYVDLQLTVNAMALPIYEQHHIPAAYWQCAFEPVDEAILPEMPHFDVVMTGNNNSLHQLRTDIETLLEELRRTHGLSYGLYGDGWTTSQGNTLYNFAASRAIFKNAHIAISDTIDSPDNRGFVSDRLWSILAAGGAIALQQFVPGLDELTGLRAGEHYIPWRTIDDLRTLIIRHLYETPLLDAQPVRDYVLKHHSFDARVQQLLQLIQTHATREIGGMVRLVNRRSTRGGGVLGPVTGTHYIYQPGVAFEVDSRDAEQLVQHYVWERV